MLGPSPEQAKSGKKISSAEQSAVSGEINPDAEAERAAFQQELNETEADMERVALKIRKLEMAAKASPTDAERQRMQKKMEEARTAGEQAGKDPEMVERLVEATKKTFLEGREGIADQLKSLEQRAKDLADQKRLLEEKLGGGAEHSA